MKSVQSMVFAFGVSLGLLSLVTLAQSQPPEPESDSASTSSESKATASPSKSSSKKKGKKNDTPIPTAADASFWAPRELNVKFGVQFQAHDNFCKQVHATIPIPMQWPEQQVTIVSTDISPGAKYAMRPAAFGAAQLVVDVPQVQMQGNFTAIVTMKIVKSFIKAPSDPSSLVIPKSKSKELTSYFGNSPYIETDDRAIKKIVAEIKEQEPAHAWEMVELLYEWVRSNVEYQFDTEIRSTKEALKKKKGDCEEMTGIFIALCRSAGVPARKVHVPDHCYGEFYLEDEHGQGHWYPCQLAGDRQFGEMNEYRPILQKGDRFRVPEFKDPQPYLGTTFTCKSPPTGTKNPEIEEIRDLGDLESDPNVKR